MIKDDIKKAATLLKEGKLVAFPTETVYGIGGNALSDAAVAAIYAAKERPEFNPLIVHVASLEAAAHYAEFSPAAETLAKKFWPGPLTLVLPRKKKCALSLLVSAGLETVAIRVPNHSVAQALLQETGLPIAAPSANKSGRISPTQASHVREELGNRVAMILDGGACEVGIESTVVDMTGDTPIILRPGSIFLPLPLGEGRGEGALTRRAAPPSPEGRGLQSPGMMERHYAPSKPLRLNAMNIYGGEVLLAFGVPLAGAAVIENLSAAGNLEEAAANLFAMLRRLDASAAESIAVMPIPETGLGIAINDRLRRAAAKP